LSVSSYRKEKDYQQSKKFFQFHILKPPYISIALP